MYKSIKVLFLVLWHRLAFSTIAEEFFFITITEEETQFQIQVPSLKNVLVGFQSYNFFISTSSCKELHYKIIYFNKFNREICHYNNPISVITHLATYTKCLLDNMDNNTIMCYCHKTRFTTPFVILYITVPVEALITWYNGVLSCEPANLIPFNNRNFK